MSQTPDASPELVPPTTSQNSATPEQIERALFELRGEQNYVAGTLAAVAAGLVGAAIWAGVTVATKYQIGWLALGIGFMVGAANRALGKGMDKHFGITGAVIALLSVALGNLLSIFGLLSEQMGLPFTSILTGFDYSQTLTVMQQTFTPMDLIFYGIATWEGYKFSFRTISQDDLRQRLA